MIYFFCLPYLGPRCLAPEVSWPTSTEKQSYSSRAERANLEAHALLLCSLRLFPVAPRQPHKVQSSVSFALGSHRSHAMRSQTISLGLGPCLSPPINGPTRLAGARFGPLEEDNICMSHRDPTVMSPPVLCASRTSS